MDLQDFGGDGLYFDEDLPAAVSALLDAAASQYAEGTAEQPLRAAEALAPQSLTVQVGLYRFFYYQHRYEDALSVAHRVHELTGPGLGLPTDWREITPEHLPQAAATSMGLLRFYLLALKGAGYLNLRLARFAEGKAMLSKVSELDSDNRLGARLLLEVLQERSADVIAFPQTATVERRS